MKGQIIGFFRKAGRVIPIRSSKVGQMARSAAKRHEIGKTIKRLEPSVSKSGIARGLSEKLQGQVDRLNRFEKAQGRSLLAPFKPVSNKRLARAQKRVSSYGQKARGNLEIGYYSGIGDMALQGARQSKRAGKAQKLINQARLRKDVANTTILAGAVGGSTYYSRKRKKK